MPSHSCSARRQLLTLTRRLVLANFLLVLCFTATYFVGLIGCATYQLGAGAAEVSALVILLNVALVVGAPSLAWSQTAWARASPSQPHLLALHFSASLPCSCP